MSIPDWTRRLRDDRGSISIFFTIMAPAFLAILGLVVDYGAQIRALQRADNIAAETARAAGQGINTGQAVAGGAKIIDPDAARTAAQQYLSALPDTSGSVDIVDATHLRVTVTVHFHPILIGLFGGQAGTAHGQATAILIAQYGTIRRSTPHATHRTAEPRRAPRHRIRRPGCRGPHRSDAVSAAVGRREPPRQPRRLVRHPG
jgi:hypothetical protein